MLKLLGREKCMSGGTGNFLHLLLKTKNFRRRLIATAKATQYRHGKWVPNMHVQEEFTKNSADATYYKKRTLAKIGIVYS